MVKQKLLDMARDTLRRKHLSYRTEQALSLTELTETQGLSAKWLGTNGSPFPANSAGSSEGPPRGGTGGRGIVFRLRTSSFTFSGSGAGKG